MKKLKKLEDLTPDDKNANKGTERGLGMLDHSLRKLGAGRSILADREGRVIAGNKTLERAAELGLPIRTVETDGRELVVVQRRDLDLKKHARARELAVADNRVAEVDLSWDPEVMQELAPMTDLGGYFLPHELGRMGIDVQALPQPEREKKEKQLKGPDVDALMKKWRVKKGDLWEVKSKTAGAPHRILCGNSAAKDDVSKLCAGTEPDALLMDPPYCSGGFQEAGRSAGSIGTKRKDAEGNEYVPRIMNDRLSTRGYKALIERILDAWPGLVAYVFTDWRIWTTLFDCLESSGFSVRSMVVWDKGTPGMGRGWRSQHELIAVGVRGTVPFKMAKASGNVLYAQRTGNELHPTQKPVDLLKRVIAVTDFARVWADPVMGSGSSIVACEESAVRCFAMDLDPRWVCVTLERLTESGLEVRKL